MKTKLPLRKIGIVIFAMFCITFQVFSQQTVTFPKIEVKDIAAQKAVSIKTTVPSASIGQKMGELYGKLFSHLGNNSVQPAGHPFTVYYSYDPNGNTEFEAGVPVSKDVQGTDEIKFKEYPAMKVLSTLYVGPYEKVGPVYEALKKYATDNKLETQPLSWEIYLTDPTSETDPNKYQTIIYFVLK